jgi:putative spermidine/putrescine transport system permease protein
MVSHDTTEDESILTRLRNGAGRFSDSEPYILTIPTVVWFAVFLLVPLLLIVYYSFLGYSSFNVIYELNIESWTGTLTDSTVQSTFARTIAIGIGVTAITLLFGYPLAYYLRFYTTELMGIVLLLFLVIPFWTSELIRTIGWLPILGNSGAINWALLSLGLIEEPMGWLLFSLFSQVVGYLQNYIVFMAAPIYISLSQIDGDLLDASETLRSGPISTFRNVTWPLSLPGVAIGCMFTFVLAVGNLTIPQFLSSGQATSTTLIYNQIGTLNYPQASVISIMLLVVIFAFVFALFRVVDISEIAQA